MAEILNMASFLPASGSGACRERIDAPASPRDHPTAGRAGFFLQTIRRRLHVVADGERCPGARTVLPSPSMRGMAAFVVVLGLAVGSAGAATPTGGSCRDLKAAQARAVLGASATL